MKNIWDKYKREFVLLATLAMAVVFYGTKQ